MTDLNAVPAHMWLAGDGEGDCASPAGDLVVASYGTTEAPHPDVAWFSISQTAKFLRFVQEHARSCRTSRGESS